MKTPLLLAFGLLTAIHGITQGSSTTPKAARKPVHQSGKGVRPPAKPRPASARPVVTGPSVHQARISAVKTEARAIGRRLLARLQTGSIVLVNHERDSPQIKSLAGKGCLCAEGGQPVSVSLNLLRTLDRLSARAGKQRPLEILSLYRTPRAGQKNEPHANGLAVDISTIAGRKIDSRNPAMAHAGVLALIESLGPGEYRLGMPKPPGTDPIALAPAPPRPARWPFFPAPLPVTMPLPGPRFAVASVVLPRPGAVGTPMISRSLPPAWVARWQNERGASASDLGSATLRAAIRRAAQRGVVIHTLFPDALDHVHLDVAPPPGRARGPAVTFDCCDD